MTRIISLVSGKGGVGKTTLSANLGSALHDFGIKTVVVDTNLTTPNLGFHLGVPLYPKTMHDVLRGNATINDAIFVHPTGMKIIPAGISISDLKNTSPEGIPKAVLDLVGDHDIVLLDGSAGLGKESLASIKAADEVLIVTNPQLPSVTDALKAIKIAEEHGAHILGVVLNRVKGHKSELSLNDVESLLGYPVVGMIPEDDIMHESLAAKTPAVVYDPKSKPSIEMKKLAASIAGIHWEPPKEQRVGFMQKLFGFLR